MFEYCPVDKVLWATTVLSERHYMPYETPTGKAHTLLNSAILKQSYAKYEEEAKRLGKEL